MKVRIYNQQLSHHVNLPGLPLAVPDVVARDDVPEVVDGDGGDGVLATVHAQGGAAGEGERQLDIGRLTLVEL